MKSIIDELKLYKLSSSPSKHGRRTAATIRTGAAQKRLFH